MTPPPKKMEPATEFEIIMKKLPHSTYCLSHGLFKNSSRNWCWYLDKAAFASFVGVQSCLQNFESRIRDDLAAFHTWIESTRDQSAENSPCMAPLKVLRTKEDITSWRQKVVDYQARLSSTMRTSDFDWQQQLQVRNVTMRRNLIFSVNGQPNSSYKTRDVERYYDDDGSDDSWGFKEVYKSSLGSTPPPQASPQDTDDDRTLPFQSRPTRKTFGESLGELLDSLDAWLALHNSTNFVKIRTHCQELLSIAGAVLDGCNCYTKHYLPIYNRLTNQRRIIQDVLDDELKFFSAYQDIAQDKDLKTAFARWPESKAYLD